MCSRPAPGLILLRVLLQPVLGRCRRIGLQCLKHTREFAVKVFAPGHHGSFQIGLQPRAGRHAYLLAPVVLQDTKNYQQSDQGQDCAGPNKPIFNECIFFICRN